MLIETGHFALALALGLSLIQFAIPMWGLAANDRVLMRLAAPAALATFVFVAFAYVALTMAYIDSDFSITNVIKNSHSAKPLLYKISGVWSNHEGSILLWVFILALFGAILALAKKSVPERLRNLSLAFQGLITFAFIGFVLIYSNPYLREFPAVLEGQDLNPILQDPGLAIHPPLLYIGYVGFSVTFAFAAAALVDGRIDAVWARAVRPWTLTAWIFLTLGIAMGSYWAYYELGWGGWWFWDPVENASLMPWLVGTALMHSTVVMERREALKVWTILLAILTFSLSLLGTFLVRSGILTSVHSFAVDPERGTAILLILMFFVGGSFLLYAWRAPMLKQGGLFAPISREGSLVLNNLLLSTACATVFIGTLYPLAIEMVSEDKISVGAPFFNMTFIPLIVPLLLALPVGQVLAWKRGDLLAVMQRLLAIIIVVLLLIAALWAFTRGGPVAAPFGVGLGVYVVLGAFNEVITRTWRKGLGMGAMLRRAIGLPRSTWGTVFAHAGVGLSVIGIAATAWGVESLAIMKPGDTLTAGAYTAKLERVVTRSISNYQETAAVLHLSRNGSDLGRIETMKRLFSSRGMPTTEAGIMTVGLGQVYATVSEFNEDGTVGLHLFHKPLVLLIWIGAVIMALGGCISLTDRRFRIGAPVRSRKQSVPAMAE